MLEKQNEIWGSGTQKALNLVKLLGFSNIKDCPRTTDRPYQKTTELVSKEGFCLSPCTE